MDMKYILSTLFFSFSLLPMQLERDGEQRNVVFVITNGVTKSQYNYSKFFSTKKKKKERPYNPTKQLNTYKKQCYAIRIRALKEEAAKEQIEIFTEEFGEAINKNNWRKVGELFFTIKEDRISRTPIIRLLDKQKHIFISYLLDILYGETEQLNKEVLRKISGICTIKEEVTSNLFKNCCLLCYEFAIWGCNKKFLRAIQNSDDLTLREEWSEYSKDNGRVKSVLENDFKQNILSTALDYLNREYSSTEFSIRDVFNMIYS